MSSERKKPYSESSRFSKELSVTANGTTVIEKTSKCLSVLPKNGHLVVLFYKGGVWVYSRFLRHKEMKMRPSLNELDLVFYPSHQVYASIFPGNFIPSTPGSIVRATSKGEIISQMAMTKGYSGSLAEALLADGFNLNESVKLAVDSSADNDAVDADVVLFLCHPWLVLAQLFVKSSEDLMKFNLDLVIYHSKVAGEKLDVKTAASALWIIVTKHLVPVVQKEDEGISEDAPTFDEFQFVQAYTGMTWMRELIFDLLLLNFTSGDDNNNRLLKVKTQTAGMKNLESITHKGFSSPGELQQFIKSLVYVVDELPVDWQNKLELNTLLI